MCNQNVTVGGHADTLHPQLQLHDSGGWGLQQRTGHCTQTCPSNTRSPWKQPSFKLARGGRSDIMDDQTAPFLPGDVLLFKRPPHFLQNENTISGYSTKNMHNQKTGQHPKHTAHSEVVAYYLYYYKTHNTSAPVSLETVGRFREVNTKVSKSTIRLILSTTRNH